MGKEPQALSVWAIAVGLSNLTLRRWDVPDGTEAHHMDWLVE